MGLVVLRHGQDGNHGDTSLLASLPTCALVHLCQVCVHISGVAAASRHFLLGCGDLTESVRIVCNVCQNDKDMHVFLKGQVLCCRQGHTGCGDTLHRRVIGQVDKEYRSVDSACLLEGLHEEVGLLKGDTHGREYNGEFLIGPTHLRLPCDLGCQLGVRQTGAGEDRQLLATDKSVQSVDGGDACLDKLGRVNPGRRVHRQTVDVPSLFREDLRASVRGASQTVKYAAQHVPGHAQLQAPSKETHLAVAQVNTCGIFIELYDNFIAVHLQHFAAAFLAVCQFNLAEFVVGDALHAFHHHQRAGNFLYGSVFFWHD